MATIQDDDCLSYSSTEHEASIHDDLRSHQLMPVSISLATDSSNVMRLQQQIRETQQRLEKERGSRLAADNKRKSTEKERQELIEKLEDVSRGKSQLEQNRIDMEAKTRNLQYQLNEELEKRKNYEVLYNKTKEQLSRKDDQYTSEVESKQKSDLTLRNLQMELRTAQTSIKQFEEEKEDLQRQLNHERNSRMLQEQINEEQAKFQQTLNGDLNSSDSQVDIMSRLEEADESKKQAFDTMEKVKAELFATKMELDRVRSRNKDNHDMMATENEELHQKIEELKSDIKLNDEALGHASLKYNLELTALRTENTKLTSNLDNERSSKEKFETEVASLTHRLDSTGTELGTAQEARNMLERQGHTVQEDLSRQLDRREQEVNHLRDTNQNLTQRVGDFENKTTKIENELHISQATLAERNNQLSTIQRELDQKKLNQDNLDDSYRREKEDNARLQAKQEALIDKVSMLEEDRNNLRRQVDESRVRQAGEGREESEKFSNILTKLREDHSKQHSSLEDKNETLNSSLSRVREDLRLSDTQRSALDQQVRRLQEDLVQTSHQRSMAEAALEVNSKAKQQYETEGTRYKAELETCQKKLDGSRDRLLDAQHKVSQLTERLEKAEKYSTDTSHQLLSQSGSLQAASRSKSELEEQLHKLELENTKLESNLKHETQRVDMLQRELDNSNQVRDTLEALVANFKSSQNNLQDKLAEASATSTLASQEAKDNQQMWEGEVKSRSKLGLRIAQLDREKQEVKAEIEEERKKIRRVSDQKKASDSKLEEEREKSTTLQKEVTLLKTHLKAAKKRLKELDTSEHRINALHTDFDRERLEMERTISTLRQQLDSAQTSLGSEGNMKDVLEGKMNQLQAELSALRSMEKSYGKLDKSKRKLEDELVRYQSHVGSNFVERTEVERHKAELEAQSRAELNQKLEEVNRYLEEQARARDKLDRMRDSNESELKRDFERSRNDLTEELSQLRGDHRQLLQQRTSQADDAKRYKDMYETEQKTREQLSHRLEKANNMAGRAQSLIERQRQSGSIYGPPMENAWMSSFSKPAPTYGMNDSFSNKIQQELDRSIAKHLEKGPHIDITLPARTLEDTSLSTSANKSRSDYLGVLQKNYFV